MKHGKIKKSKSQLRAATIELLADSKYIEYVHYMITLFTHHPRLEKIREKQKKQNIMPNLSDVMHANLVHLPHQPQLR